MTKPSLVWNVYIGDFNARKIVVHNVFEHWGFLDDCKKAARKYAKDREAFEKEVRSSLRCWYWSKCEWEITLHHWPPHESFRSRKVDVAEQVELNWPQFADYIWSHAVDLRRREKKGETE